MINVPTKEQLDGLPRLNETEHIRPGEKIAHIHFTADQYHWWAIEWDGQDIFFGFILLNVDNQYHAEFRYFSLSELLKIKVMGWLEVLNDPYWIPSPLQEIALIKQSLHFKTTWQD